MMDKLSDLSLENKRALARQLLRQRNQLDGAPVPLSEGQRALWFIYQLAPKSPAYNFVYAVRVAADLKSSALLDAVSMLFVRHPLLRSTYSMRERKPLFHVRERMIPDLIEVEAAGWARDELIEHIRSAALEPFDLGKGPCFRIALYRTGPGESVLSLAVHHILADLWSMNLLVDELRILYAASVEGRTPDLPHPTARYAEYVRWQREWLVSRQGRAAGEFWKATLEGAPPALDLPADRPRPRIQTFNGSAATCPIGNHLFSGLRELASREGTTLFTIIYAAFVILLRRYTGQDDLVIGTATAGRSRPEWERVVGYFLNQVPLRMRIDSRASFLELLRRAQRVVLSALEHQDFPFNLLVEQLRPARDPSRPPIFQVMFVWDKSIDFSPSQLQRTEPLSALGPAEPLVMEQCGAPFDLTLIVFENADDLRATLRYNVDLFDRATIERMAANFQTLLASIVADPRRSVDELPILSAEGAKQVLRMAQGSTRNERSQIQPFPRLFEMLAEQSPSTTAVIFGGEHTSYRELNSRANRLAHHLRSLGVRKGDLVGICLPRSCEMVTAILAIWKAGAAYVPLDPMYPRLRLEAMIEDASPASIVTSNGLAPRLADYQGPIIRLDEPGSIEAEPDSNPSCDVGPDDLAYAIFTSGSTGKPKAALLVHRGLSNLIEAQVEVFGAAREDRVLQFAPLSFDASVFEIMMALGVGATLVMAGQSAIIPGSDLVALIKHERVTIIQLPPSLLALISPVDLPDVHTIIVAGEECPASLVSRWAPGRRFFNAYGPTETTVWASTALCSADGKPPTIGRPIANTRLLVLDANLQLLPIGVAGELHIAGPGVGLGYLNRPDLTLEQFVPNPYSFGDDGALYKTGDIARLRADGEFEFLGRRDHQVKIRGYRIDLGEIRGVLRRHSAVDDAFVTAETLDGCDSPSLIAYLSCADPIECPIAEIRSFLRDRLPYYMVPTTFVPVRGLPLSANGKIDRSALPVVNGESCRNDRACAHQRADRAMPTSPVESKLAEIWTEVLKNGPVGIHDNFFDLGGASLQTLEVVALAGNAGILVTPELILQHQSIAELAPRCKFAGGAQPQAKETPQAAQAASESFAPSRSTATATRRTVIECLGIYLPDRKLSTPEVVGGCRLRLDLPIERMTGIKNRRIVADGEYSIDLAAKALADCLSRSDCRPDEIELLICCNISRCDGPNFEFSFEPSTAARLQERFGLEHALAFDISNACAGTFTAIALADSFFELGIFRNALVVSGEYITHLTRTAQLEIENFVDSRLACLTVGDSGVAILLTSRPSSESGFLELDLLTLGAHSDLCVARATDRPHGGAIMLTDAVKASAVTIEQAVRHAIDMLNRRGWRPESIDQLIMHQTSVTTLDGAVREINRVAGGQVCHQGNTVYNLAELGNTATNTHMLALAAAIESGRVKAGSKIVFAISGSGQTVGTALYRFDREPDLLVPESKRNTRTTAAPPSPAFEPHERPRGLASSSQPFEVVPREEPSRRSACARSRGWDVGRRVRVAAAGTLPSPEDSRLPRDALSMAVRAAESCIEETSIDRTSIGLVLHAGVYRDDFQSEPALAAMAAGRLGINHKAPSPRGQKTLAFDMPNGAVGPLNACFAAACWIIAGRASRALVLASEVENNARFGPNAVVGLHETGSAILLEESSNHEGFGRFLFRSFPQFIDDIRAFTATCGGAPMLQRNCHPECERHFALALQLAVAELLEEERIARDQIKVVIPPWATRRFAAILALALELPVSQFIEPLEDGGDYFTSSLAYGLVLARHSRGVHPGDIGLFLAAGSGGQVGCCLYYF